MFAGCSGCRPCNVCRRDDEAHVIDNVLSEAVQLEYSAESRYGHFFALSAISKDSPVSGAPPPVPAPARCAWQADEQRERAVSSVFSDVANAPGATSTGAAAMRVQAAEPASAPVSQEDGVDASINVEPSAALRCENVVSLQGHPPQIRFLEAGKFLRDFPMRIIHELTNPRVAASSLANWDASCLPDSLQSLVSRRPPQSSQGTQGLASDAFRAAMDAIGELFPRAGRAARQVEDVAREKPEGESTSSKRFI